MTPISTQAWSWLEQELQHWADSGRMAEFWWRDDDATEWGAALEKLVRLSDLYHAPVALAVIPSRVKTTLANYLKHQQQVQVLQHGYCHESHAWPGRRKRELGGNYSTEEILRELGEGQEILESHFPGRFQAVIVPPWNRIDERVVQRLPGSGFIGISTMKVRKAAFPVEGLLQVNAHLDPVNWRGNGGFIGTYISIAILVQHLQAKRLGYRDPEEPTGILTHHLVQGNAVWLFVEQLLDFLQAHPAARWVDAASIWKA